MNGLLWMIKDSWVITQRNLKRIFRDLDSLITSIALPIVIMLLFVYVFGGAIQTGTEYVNYVVPGIIITCIGYSSTLIAMAISQDMTGGFLQRLRTMPVRPISLLLAHVSGSMVRNGISTSLVFAVALAIGFRPSAIFLEWLGIIGLLMLLLAAFSWLGILFGLLAKTPETAGAFAMVVIFLPYISSAFVPTETMPRWLAVFAEYQPLTPMIESLRDLLIGTSSVSSHWPAIIWLAVITLLSCFAGILVYRLRSITK